MKNTKNINFDRKILFCRFLIRNTKVFAANWKLTNERQNADFETQENSLVFPVFDKKCVKFDLN